MKRLISLSMAAMMAGSLLPMSAFANDDGNGWHYEGNASVINKSARNQNSNNNNNKTIGVNNNKELYEDDVYGSGANSDSKKYVSLINGAKTLDDEDYEPWEIATANAPEVQMEVTRLLTAAGGSFDKDQPYVVTEFDIDIEDAVLVGEHGNLLTAEELLHLVSITRDGTKYAVRDIMLSNPSGSLQGLDQFPDIYIQDINKRTVGGVTGISSFNVVLRSNVTNKNGFDSNVVSIQDDLGIKATTYHSGLGTNFDATGVATSGDAVSGALQVGDIISVKLPTSMKSSSRSSAYVNIVSEELNLSDNYNYANIVDGGMSVSYTRGKDNIAQGEVITLSGDIIIKEAVAGSFDFDDLDEDAKVTFKLSKGFEFYFPEKNADKVNAGQKYDAINTNLMNNLGGGRYYDASHEDGAGWYAYDSYGSDGASDAVVWETSGTEFSLAILDSANTAGVDITAGGGSPLKSGVTLSDPKEYDTLASTFTNSSSVLETLRINATTYDDSKGESQVQYGGIGIEATTANVGDVATIEITIEGVGTQTIEVAQVVDYAVMLNVDSSQDVPVMFSGVNRDNDGLSTSNKSNYALEVTIEETFPGAWDVSQGFTITLPEEVYVVNDEDYSGSKTGEDRNAGVYIVDVNNLYSDEDVIEKDSLFEKMEEAYEDGGYQNFTFGRRPFNGQNTSLGDEVSSITFQLVLSASYGFEGEVELGLDLHGTGVDPEPVVIAEFVKPFEVSADQNDVIIDYRNLSMDSQIKFVEYEAGLLTDLGVHTLAAGKIDGKNRVGDSQSTIENYINFQVDRGDYIQFDSANFEINTDDSDATFRSYDGNGINSSESLGGNAYKDLLEFYLGEESRNVPLEVVIDEMELFMQRSIPAGSYSLSLGSNMLNAMKGDAIFAGDIYDNSGPISVAEVYRNGETDVESKFVNVVTAGSDQDNAFLTQIIVPVGESYIYSGGRMIDLNATEGGATPPAYIKDGRTMLPIRAVTEAFGLTVDWINETQTVAIKNGSTVINMTVGENVAKIGGNVEWPLLAPVELVNSRSYIGFRDLGLILGVVNDNINYDLASNTAILNGSVEDILAFYGTDGTVEVEVEADEVVETEEVE